MPKKLFLLGLGVEPEKHATIEVLQAAGECEVVLCDGLDEANRRWLSRFLAPGVKPSPVGSGGVPAALKKISAALDAGKTAALITAGHPFYWSALGGRLAALADREKAEWRTFGAISPMGMALAASGVTLGTTVHGMQAFDARFLTERSVKLNTTWPLVLYFYEPLDKKAAAALAKRLTAEYGAAHPAIWCLAGEPKRAALVGGLAAELASAGANRVLYIERKAESQSRVGRTDHHPMKRDDKKAPAWVKQ